MKVRALFVAVSLLPLVGGCALFDPTFGADPINSQIVDEDTGEPIEGAVVVAHWQLNGGSISAMPCGSANVEEAVTDRDGRFHLPGWGPVRSGCASEMRIGEPVLYVFKAEYDYGFFPNGSGTETVTVTHSSFDGRQLSLQKYPDMDLRKEGPHSYRFNFGELNGELSNFTASMPGECNWKKMPAMLLAIGEMAQKFESTGSIPDTINNQLITNDAWIQKIAPQCGSPKAFIEGLVK